MNTRKIITLATAALFAIGTLTACGGAESEPTETSKPTPTVEPIELDPEKMTGKLNQEQSVIFVGHTMESFDVDVCEMVGADLAPSDTKGIINLTMDLAGYEQDVERITGMGSLIYARDTCDY